jgi:hypothetical protein
VDRDDRAVEVFLPREQVVAFELSDRPFQRVDLAVQLRE